MIFLNVETAKFSHLSDSIQIFKGVNLVYPWWAEKDHHMIHVLTVVVKVYSFLYPKAF